MRTQEQAFRAYYASMTDAELLQTAANRGSFLAIAQQVLTEEMRKRHLNPQPEPAPPGGHSVFRTWGEHLAGFARRIHLSHHRVST